MPRSAALTGGALGRAEMKWEGGGLGRQGEEAKSLFLRSTEAEWSLPGDEATRELPKRLSQLMALFNHTPCPEEYCLTDNFVCLTRFC